MMVLDKELMQQGNMDAPDEVPMAELPADDLAQMCTILAVLTARNGGRIDVTAGELVAIVGQGFTTNTDALTGDAWVLLTSPGVMQ